MHHPEIFDGSHYLRLLRRFQMQWIRGFDTRARGWRPLCRARAVPLAADFLHPVSATARLSLTFGQRRGRRYTQLILRASARGEEQTGAGKGRATALPPRARKPLPAGPQP